MLLDALDMVDQNSSLWSPIIQATCLVSWLPGEYEVIEDEAPKVCGPLGAPTDTCQAIGREDDLAAVDNKPT